MDKTYKISKVKIVHKTQFHDPFLDKILLLIQLIFELLTTSFLNLKDIKKLNDVNLWPPWDSEVLIDLRTQNGTIYLQFFMNLSSWVIKHPNLKKYFEFWTNYNTFSSIATASLWTKLKTKIIERNIGCSFRLCKGRSIMETKLVGQCLKRTFLFKEGIHLYFILSYNYQYF